MLEKRPQLKNGRLRHWVYASDEYYHATWYAIPREGILMSGALNSNSGYLIISDREAYLRQPVEGYVHRVSASDFEQVVAPNGDPTPEWVCDRPVMVAKDDPVDKITSLEQIMAHGTQVIFCNSLQTKNNIEGLIFHPTGDPAQNITRLILQKHLLWENLRRNINVSKDLAGAAAPLSSRKYPPAP